MMIRRILLPLFVWILAFRALAGQPAAPVRHDTIWSGVVLATNVENPASPDAELLPIEEKLKSVFGYNQFELVGRHIELMDDPSERWLVPSKVFCLRVLSRHTTGKTYLLKLQLYQRTKMLAQFDANFTSQSPLVIRGPLCGKGQLLFVLLMK